MQVITNEKVQFVKIYVLSTDFYEGNYSKTTAHRWSIGKII